MSLFSIAEPGVKDSPCRRLNPPWSGFTPKASCSQEAMKKLRNLSSQYIYAYSGWLRNSLFLCKKSVGGESFWETTILSPVWGMNEAVVVLSEVWYILIMKIYIHFSFCLHCFFALLVKMRDLDWRTSELLKRLLLGHYQYVEYSLLLPKLLCTLAILFKLFKDNICQMHLWIPVLACSCWTMQEKHRKVSACMYFPASRAVRK